MIENLRSLAILAAVVETGSFRGAGEKLGLSASVVSHHISNLEKRLNCTIFFRTSRQLQLTDKGKTLHKAGQEMVGIVGEALAEVSEGNTLFRGNLRIAIPQVLACPELLLTVEGFLATNPKIDLELDLSADIISPQNSDYDIIITQCKSSDAALSFVKLTDISLIFVAAPDLAAKIENIPLNDAPAQVPIIGGPGLSLADWENAFSQALGAKTSIGAFRLSCDSISVAHKMACSGAGVIAMPDFRVSADLNSGRLVRVFTELTQPKLSFNFVSQHKGIKRGLIQRFRDHLLSDLDLTPAAGTQLRRSA